MRKPFKLGILFSLIHFSLAMLMVVLIHFAEKTEPEAGMGWVIFYYADMPISLLLKLVLYNFFPDMGGSNFAHFVFFSVAGSGQYYLIGACLGWLYKKFAKKEDL